MNRHKYFAEYADMIWVETSKPRYEQAVQISEFMKEHHPNRFMCYNLSPSFNWSTAGMTDEEIRSFIPRLGKLGFSWCFITLAGFHLNGLETKRFTTSYCEDKMLAYVRDIQRKEIELGMTMVKHQQWSGTSVSDKITQLATGSETTLSCGKASTENQFQ